MGAFIASAYVFAGASVLGAFLIVCTASRLVMFQGRVWAWMWMLLF